MPASPGRAVDEAAPRLPDKHVGSRYGRALIGPKKQA
jgi:hypothetical protein